MTQNNSKKMLIGITGGIATGKSMVSNYLISLGYSIVDFDEISKSIYSIDGNLYKEVVDYFGDEILGSKKEIDRKKLGDIVFSDESKLGKLNSLVHSYIYSVAKKKITKLDDDIIFLDIPLLYETKGYLKEYDIQLKEVWLVYCDKETQIKRVMNRDQISEEEAKRKVYSQMSMEDKLREQNRVIYNDKSIDYAHRQVDILLKNLKP